MFGSSVTYPVGGRVLIRDAEWRITEVAQTSHAGVRLRCTGLSELVRNKDCYFFEGYEKSIQLLLPEETNLKEDHSPNFMQTKLYLEALIRTAPRTDASKIEVAHLAVMDPLPYQFNPALQALSQPRARILIADAVGIGKTLEAGILTSELIARGRGRRILVVATKAMLTQFQQEFWNRFTIPLVRLDSSGIQRLRNRIPANHNPFLHIDRAIISIDTLKQDLEYREHLSKAYWDIIIIDEAHNVAERKTRSQRARLAQLLAGCSDTMIMLTATPHDGSAESFASLLNILDPTAIASPKDYKLDDFKDKGLVIRRFKADIQDQIRKDFPERKIEREEIQASAAEQAVFEKLASANFATLDAPQRKGARLFATTLTKAFFSSPAALLSVIGNRIRKLERSANAAKAQADIQTLKELKTLAEAVTPEKFAKFMHLCRMLQSGSESIGWTGQDPEDRLVIFTESIETLDFLAKELSGRAGIPKEFISVLKGSMTDADIAEKVNEFNRRDSKVRLLLCSDVASEGLNLHHLAHRMIHFDIPWSLMTFQQRNGRIDRYGQTQQPLIWYLQTMGSDERSQGDARVLELLQEKDMKAQHNLSDPAEFILSQEEQEDRTAAEMEGHAEPLDEFEDIFGDLEEDSADGHRSTAIAPVLKVSEYKATLACHATLFKDDMAYARAVLRWLNENKSISSDQLDFPDEHRILLGIPPDLEARIKYLPAEVLPENGRFDLTDDRSRIQKEMDRVRVIGAEWPAQTFLWPLHPVMRWMQDRALGIFGRHTAPVVRLKQLERGERWALLQGGFPNRRGYIPIHRWVAVQERNGELKECSLEEMIAALGFDRQLSNLVGDSAEKSDIRKEFGSFIKRAVDSTHSLLAKEKEKFDATAKADLERRLEELAKLKRSHMEQLEIDLGLQLNETIRKKKKEAQLSQIENHFRDAREYLVNTAETEKEPYIQLAAVFSAL